MLSDPTKLSDLSILPAHPSRQDYRTIWIKLSYQTIILTMYRTILHDVQGILSNHPLSDQRLFLSRACNRWWGIIQYRYENERTTDERRKGDEDSYRTNTCGCYRLVCCGPCYRPVFNGSSIAEYSGPVKGEGIMATILIGCVVMVVIGAVTLWSVFDDLTGL